MTGSLVWVRTRGRIELRSVIVPMVQTTDTGPSDHFASAGAAYSLVGSLLLESAMGAVVVIVVDVGSEQTFQMR